MREITWRRRSSREKFKWRVNPLIAVLLSIVFAGTTLGGFAGAFIWANCKGQTQPEPVLVWVTVGSSAVYSLLFFYGMQLLGGTKKGIGRLRLCNKCFKLSVDKLNHCDCGGRFEDVYGWKLNKCDGCGYDLRVTESRCPECGRPIPAIDVDLQLPSASNSGPRCFS